MVIRKGKKQAVRAGCVPVCGDTCIPLLPRLSGYMQERLVIMLPVGKVAGQREAVGRLHVQILFPSFILNHMNV